MRYQMRANPLVKLSAARLPAEGERGSEELLKLLDGVEYITEVDGGLTIYSQEAMAMDVPPEWWITKDANGFIGKQDHEGFTDEWEPADE